MPTVPYTILSPSGNTTILAPTAGLTVPEQSRLAAHLLAEGVGEAEQMGFYTMQPAALRMAGGEFCVNATRALAVLLAMENIWPCDGQGHWRGRIFTSGLEQEVDAHVCRAGADYAAEVTLTMLPPSCEAVDTGLTLVRVPGIAHLLIDADVRPFPEHWREVAQGLRTRWGLTGEDAAGCVWWQQVGEQWRIDPVVTVREPLTTFYESACGSGSLALAAALYAHHGHRSPHTWRIAQPGGDVLDVRLQRDGHSLTACVGGIVRLVASGEAHL